MRFKDYLSSQGYAPFRGSVDRTVYEGFGCPAPAKAEWFHRPGSFQCAGCKEQCETDSPLGFQLPLGIRTPTP